ncbi:MAG: TIGR02281 family clan AA aspartic protease [Hyphomicrobiales bacterium]|nr:TIGR02281 family clan AA aspartic protease [Hyphomicrobiales bacterium]MCP4999860.1 TIGR02281 family clan AA aspartic protease [Hyphomicrobiales bacterium]
MMRIILLATVVSGIAVSVPKIAADNEKNNPSGQISQSRQRVLTPAASATVSYTSGRDVVLEADSRGHYVGTFKINGRKIDGLIDTGATAVAINRSSARKLGIWVTPGMFKYRISTANGSVRAARVKLRTVELRSIRVRDVEAYVLDDKSLGGMLVGMSFLNRLKSFQARDGKLILKR